MHKLMLGERLCCGERGGLSGLMGKGQEVKDAGAAAMIVMNDEFSGNVTATNLHLLPASHVTHADGLSMKAFINSKSSPMATILFKGTVFDALYDPRVAIFSSRGPSLANPGILKLDILVLMLAFYLLGFIQWITD